MKILMGFQKIVKRGELAQQLTKNKFKFQLRWRNVRKIVKETLEEAIDKRSHEMQLDTPRNNA